VTRPVNALSALSLDTFFMPPNYGMPSKGDADSAFTGRVTCSHVEDLVGIIHLVSQHLGMLQFVVPLRSGRVRITPQGVLTGRLIA
jgi:hypothetical protein